jgi:hypothetical protein
MNDQSPSPGTRQTLDVYLREEARLISVQRRQLERWQGGRAPTRAHSLEFDESGFPLPQHPAGFVERIRHLLSFPS